GTFSFPAMAKHCAQCGAALGERGKFCHRCGAPREGAAATSRTPSDAARPATLLPWVIAAIAVLALVAFIAGQKFGGGTASQPAVANAPQRAPDITSMSPQERADRLFDRVMQLSSRGQGDSVQFFAPMAIQA